MTVVRRHSCEWRQLLAHGGSEAGLTNNGQSTSVSAITGGYHCKSVSKLVQWYSISTETFLGLRMGSFGATNLVYIKITDFKVQHETRDSYVASEIRNELRTGNCWELVSWRFLPKDTCQAYIGSLVNGTALQEITFDYADMWTVGHIFPDWAN